MASSTDPLGDGVATSFIQAHQDNVIGVLHGFDRLRLQGTLRSLYHPEVMVYYLRRAGVLWKDFKAFATGLTERVRQAAVALAQTHHRPMKYLPASSTSKEEVARQIADRDGVRSGLVTVLSCVEPCRTWFARGNHATKKLELKLQWGKCLHLYFYFLHEQLGWLHLRLQTWFPFLIQVCLNGREWLARQMDQAGVAYRRADNCFPWIADVARAQELMHQQLRTDWPELLRPLVAQCHPLHAEITRPIERDYYWTAAESEYAADVMFRDRAALERIYPALIHHSVMHLGSEQVLRFMGRPRGPHTGDDVKSDRRRGPDGVRVKHWLNTNSQKLYDKGSVLRSETTINEPKDFRVWRGPESNPAGKNQWRILRRSVADLHRRAEVSRAACQRHMEALAAVNVKTPLAQEAATVCRPIRKEGRRHRALNPLAQTDATLLSVVNRGEYVLNGFRNRDVRHALHGRCADPRQRRRDMARVGRQLALLRAHGLIRKVSRTHRYMVTASGRRVITALLAALHANTEQLVSFAT
jgi:hypothetical protein